MVKNEVRATFAKKLDNITPINSQPFSLNDRSFPRPDLQLITTDNMSKYQLAQPQPNNKKFDQWVLGGLTGTTIAFLGFTQPPAQYIGAAAFIGTFAYPYIRDVQEKKRFSELELFKPTE